MELDDLELGSDDEDNDTPESPKIPDSPPPPRKISVVRFDLPKPDKDE